MLIPLLSQAALGEAPQEIQGYAMATLNNLVSDTAARTAVIDASGVDILLPLTLGMKESWLKQQAIEMLSKMGVDTEAASAKAILEPIGNVGKRGTKTQASSRPQVKSSVKATAAR